MKAKLILILLAAVSFCFPSCTVTVPGAVATTTLGGQTWRPMPPPPSPYVRNNPMMPPPGYYNPGYNQGYQPGYGYQYGPGIGFNPAPAPQVNRNSVSWQRGAYGPAPGYTIGRF